MNNPQHITSGIPDNEFIRGNVPMTKEEIRVLSLSKLYLTKGDRIIDIGAGTGSISIEIARLLPESKVFAIEYQEIALDLIRQNRMKFSVPNIEIIAGMAPEVLHHITDVNKVFIGGSGGNLKTILQWVEENTQTGARLVVNAITLDTLFLTREYLRNAPFHLIEIIQVSINRTEKIGNSAMFRPQSPVIIISATRL